MNTKDSEKANIVIKPSTSPDLINSPKIPYKKSSTSPELIHKQQNSDKKPNFISKNIEKLRKKPIDVTFPSIDITELIESESTPKSSKPQPKPNNRVQSLCRPMKRSESKVTDDPKSIQKSLTGTSKTLYQKDVEIENLLKIDEFEGRQSPQISNSPVKYEEKPNKRSASKAPEGSNEITTSLKSQEFLANKFIKDFQTALSEVEANADTLDQKNMILLLQKLRFIKNENLSTKHEEEVNQVQKLWKMINGESSTVKIQNLLSICLNIMNLYSPTGHFADSESIGLKSWSFMNGIFVYNSDEALKVHKMFFEFYQNRRFAPKKVNESMDMSQEYSFKPIINRNSRDLASEGRSRYGSLGSQKREEFLNKKKEEIDKKREKVEKKNDSEAKIVSIQPTLLARSGSRQKKVETVAKNPAPKPEARKVPILPRKNFKARPTATSPRVEPEKKTVEKEFQTVKVESNFEKIKKIKEEREKRVEQNIFRHKKSNSNVGVAKGPVKVFKSCVNSEFVSGTITPSKENLTERSEIINFDGEISMSSPLLNNEVRSVEVFEKIDEDCLGQDEEVKDFEGISGRMALGGNNHAATLQLISFINEHNLDEDSAEKLLKIFQMGPKIS